MNTIASEYVLHPRRAGAPPLSCMSIAPHPAVPDPPGVFLAVLEDEGIFVAVCVRRSRAPGVTTPEKSIPLYLPYSDWLPIAHLLNNVFLGGYSGVRGERRDCHGSEQIHV